VPGIARWNLIQIDDLPDQANSVGKVTLHQVDQGRNAP
jgi:hypothetical protein